MIEWRRIGEVPIDTGRLVLVDPMNVDDVRLHEDDLLDRLETKAEAEEPSMSYELITNEHGVAVALIVETGLGDGLYPVEAPSRRLPAPSGSQRSGSGSYRIR